MGRTADTTETPAQVLLPIRSENQSRGTSNHVTSHRFIHIATPLGLSFTLLSLTLPKRNHAQAWTSPCRNLRTGLINIRGGSNCPPFLMRGATAPALLQPEAPAPCCGASNT